MEQFVERVIQLIRSDLPRELILSRKESVQNKIIQKIEQRKNRRIYLYSSAVAACFLLIVLFSTPVWVGVGNDDDVLWTQVVTLNGEKDTVQLADGSTIVLNGGSLLKYPERFTNKRRLVKLDGEGYFDIAPNKKVPFDVETGAVTIKVLGTKFNLKAYEVDSVIETILEEGHVQLSNQQTNEVVNMLPNDKVFFDKQINTFVKTTTDGAKAAWWKEQKYEFTSMSFVEICKILERGFGVVFVLENEQIVNKKFTATFNKNETVEDILHIFQLSSSFKYTLNGKTITIQ